ncbi:MAG TPA: hypothetical protein PLZ95_05185, partial [Bryobacteraceae bacterium]|nr:hypothetical protein [Bryobacteraceae bacterium]
LRKENCQSIYSMAENGLGLSISDHLDWTDSLAHQLVLQEKINRYLAFIESGEILEHQSDAAERRICIHVVLKYEPDPSGLAFLGRAANVLNSAGFGFSYRVLEIVQ